MGFFLLKPYKSFTSYVKIENHTSQNKKTTSNLRPMKTNI